MENLVRLGSPHHGAALERFGFHLAGQTRTFPLCQNHRAYRQYPQQWHSGLALWQCAR